MQRTLFTYRRDSYTASRGRPSLLEITCERCRAFVALYQKDGPGPLKRMYLNRILAPAMKKTKELACPGCGEILGVSIIYAKENRSAFRLFVAAVAKKPITLKKASTKRYT